MTDLRSRLDALNTYPCLVTRTTEPDEILTLVDTAELSDTAERSDGAEMPDPLIGTHREASEAKHHLVD